MATKQTQSSDGKNPLRKTPVIESATFEVRMVVTLEGYTMASITPGKVGELLHDLVVNGMVASANVLQLSCKACDACDFCGVVLPLCTCRAPK